MDKPYSTKEISLTLNIGTSTLRKWCLALEKYNYSFIRNDQNQRLFTESDFVALRHFQTMVQDHNFSLENAAVVIASRFSRDTLSNETPLERLELGDTSVLEQRSNEDKMATLLEHFVD